MEVGIANGENAKRMVDTAKTHSPSEKIRYYGFDIFSENVPEEKDSQLKSVKRKLNDTGCNFTLFKGDSTTTLPNNVHKLPIMDLIFIDGGHAYQTVKSDWSHSKRLMDTNTAIFFHNADWKGPKKVINNIPQEKYIIKSIDPPSDTPIVRVKLRKR